MNQKQILMIDDDEELSMVISDMLENYGYRVTCASDSETAFDLLAYLCEHKNTAIPKQKLLTEVWGAFCMVELSTLTVHIRWLREKLEDNPTAPVYIKTVWGVGYRLEVKE